ncbi:hypothetical protein Javan336_0033 [Streptococcus phage Javan336]|uniref:YopX protein domain-containing protein n=1 Tax=Streptococcus mitis TaxID=28037 RepID=A0A081R159_STRMT|nr:YopX family protein [Streptococcus mitis]KEQ48932.1 hypothetical protein SK608_0229 [Streptococcus mitis]QBX26623.1 hypothetical protein Javan336_0033 [Streptococcus phage Javan336]
MKLKFRAWLKKKQKMDNYIDHISWLEDELYCIGDGITYMVSAEDLVLMQSTGLKDKNGVEIFEGDVVRMRNPRDRRQIGMFQVVRVANSPMLGLLDKKLTTEIFNLYEHMSNYYEVKGNIYENPELLEDKE